MRFCSATSSTLTRLSRRIRLSKTHDTEMQTAFDQSAALLSAAVAELDRRYPDPHRDEE